MAELMMVGIDGSEGSTRAVDFATARAQTAGASLLVVYVIEWSPYSFQTPEENAQRHKRRQDEIITAETKALEPVLGRIQATGLTAEGLVRHGHPSETLAQLAKEKGAVQIFIGRRGISSLQAMLFGSVAGSLVQISPVPVTVVP